MEIISLNFAAFVIICLTIFYLLPGKFQNLFLLLASYYFYYTYDWAFVIVLAGLSLFNYKYAHFLRSDEKPNRYKLWAGILFNLAIFGFFLFDQVFEWGLPKVFRRLGLQDFVVEILLPIGISYYILEGISYLIDVFRKHITPSTNWIDFALYLAYFPKLISGPIERARTFLPQLSEERSIGDEVITHSFLLIVDGLIRTVVLGGILTIMMPNSVFRFPAEFSAPDLLFWITVFGFIIYNQFAGYTNIVRGISGLFGIELSRNFSYPFLSRDFSEFWTRWHISLSQWLRDYVFMPLSRAFLRRNPSRHNLPNLLIPPMVTMLVSGLWHGATPNLIVWGFLNGVYMITENAISLFKPANPSKKVPLWRQISSMLFIIFLLVLSAVLFQLDLITSAAYFKGLFTWDTWALTDLRPLVFIALTLLLDIAQKRAGDEFSLFLKFPKWLRSPAIALAVFAIFVAHKLQSAPAPFIYP